MILTLEQYNMLYDMINASIKMSSLSGIPINDKIYADIDEIKEKIRQDIAVLVRRNKD